ncbi:hypothetical protein OHA09_13940 [Streptomyces longwoodensis]|uniref:hypothetical protein n=1 Tax=Streptomyces longwoodensis TaxID=68231 RepID=UPI002E81A3D6|nr:hypothetical protein [Streptomyces longwoodensis]WUC58118.1 hypothetical protein OHA09_13940 [Streptomyces longwoodensis]
MEQRRGSSSQPLKAVPVKGAGFDPAFIPGLTAPAGEQPEDARPDEAGPDGKAEAAAAAPADAGASGKAPEAAGTAEPEDTDAAAAVDDGDVAAADDADDDAEPAADGPVFEAADRRARIVADRRGVRLALDDQGCEFRWDEIGAVETETARFGKRFTVTVHTPDSRWYPIEIEAKARSDFKQWDEQLDAVLDAYFEAE